MPVGLIACDREAEGGVDHVRGVSTLDNDEPKAPSDWPALLDVKLPSAEADEGAEVEVQGGPLSVSVGVAMFEPGMHTVEDLLVAADHALYKAKRAGRNRVRVFGERGEIEDEVASATWSARWEAESIGGVGALRFVGQTVPEDVSRPGGAERMAAAAGRHRLSVQGSSMA